MNAMLAHMRHGDIPAVAGTACPNHLVGTTATTKTGKHTKNGNNGKGHGKGK